MEASPLDLRGVTVIPRALLEGIRGDDDKQQQQQPSVHQQPPVDIPFGQPLTLTVFRFL